MHYGYANSSDRQTRIALGTNLADGHERLEGPIIQQPTQRHAGLEHLFQAVGEAEAARRGWVRAEVRPRPTRGVELKVPVHGPEEGGHVDAGLLATPLAVVGVKDAEARLGRVLAWLLKKWRLGLAELS